MIRNFTLKRKKGKTNVVPLFTLLLSLLALESIGQEVYEFSNAGATGREGPTQGQVNAAYAGTNLDGNVVIETQGIQEWVVPATGLYQIELAGATAGTARPDHDGLGRRISGEVMLTEGQLLKIVVGQQGLVSDQSATALWKSGGGGASWVYSDDTPLIVAGGGGGAGQLSSKSDAPFDANFYSGWSHWSTFPQLQNTNVGHGGQAGDFSANATSLSLSTGAGGGGWLSDGAESTENRQNSYDNRGRGKPGNFIGGTASNFNAHGGFGGGAAGTDNTGAGGGGGGYTGGPGGDGYNAGTNGSVWGAGGGGSSYWSENFEQIQDLGTNDTNGEVIVTELYFVSALNIENASCTESSDGSINAQITGGVPPYTFEWSTGQVEVEAVANAQNQVSDLAPGDYTITVTDNDGLEMSGTFTVGPDPIEVSFDMTQTTTCEENGDGVLTANVTGGTAPYTYVWSSGETDATISNKAFGEYTVTVTDANDCASVDGTESITVNDNLAPEALAQNIEVYLDATGAASIVAQDIDFGSSDDCSIANRSIDVSEFSCADIGAEPVFDGNTVLDLDGDDDRVHFDQLISFSSNHTIATWIKMDASENGVIFSWGSPTVNNYTYFFVQSGRIRYSSGNGTPSPQSVAGTTFIGDNEWHHVAATRNSLGDVNLYIDGNFEASGNLALHVDNPTQTSIGAGLLNGAYQLPLDGHLDEFAYWTEELSASEVQDIQCSGVQGADIYLDFESGAGTNIVADASGNGNSASLVNMDANSDWASFGEPKPLASCPVGVKVRLTVTDAGGNEAEADAYVTVNDTISPTAISKSFTVELGANGIGALSAEDVDNGSTDNCAVDEMSVSKESFNCENLGTNQVIMSVTDIHGNSKSTSAEVEVVDLLEPTLSVQNVQVSLDEEGNASITTDDAEVSSADNCGIANKTLSLTDFSCEDLGEVIEVDMTVTDGSGNTHSETFEVTVIEENEPTADPQAYTVALDENGLVEFDQTMIDDFIGGNDTDDCSGIDADSRSIAQTQFTCEDLGENTVTYSVSDLSGNTGTAPVVITIVDELAPTAIAQNIVAELDEDGLAVISAADADNGSTDNCSVATRELNITEFSCENLGEQEVTMTVADASGNESQASFTVEVVDQVAPAITEGLSATVYLDENGQGIFDTAPLLAQATDNCGVEAIVASMIGEEEQEYMDVNGFPFSCEEVGSSSGPLYVRDNSGNLTEFMLELNVVDTIKPSFDLSTIELQVDAEGNAFLSEEMLTQYAADNCGVAEVAIQTEQFDCSQIGSTQSTEIIVFDLHGNATQQTLEVQLIDNLAPEVQVEDITIELGADGFASLSSDALDMMIQDNCTPEDFQLSSESFSCENLGTNNAMITVTDASGNSGSAQFNVTVVDNVAPQIEGPQVIQVCQGNPVSYEAITASDNCSAELIIVEGLLSVDTGTPGEYMIQAQAFDPSGNAASRDIMVVVEPAAIVDLGEDMQVEIDELVTLVAGENSANAYLWSTGETTPSISFMAQADVTISVEVTTPEGCVSGDDINIELINPLGVNEDANGNSVRFFPNPTSGNVSLKLGLNRTVTNLQITIMDMSGKAIDQKMIPAAQNGQVINLDLSQAAKGVYLVNVKADELNLTERVVKQ